MAASEAPPFWWKQADWRPWALWPLSAVYGLVASARMAGAKRQHVSAAVLCVGNLTVGGEGKTPIAIALAKEAKRQKRRVGFLSRGYGGHSGGPHLVDRKHDTPRHVGDEPMLLARHAPTVVSPDRVAGARKLIAEGCDFIIMDDGFQSARLRMDYALIVVDARRGLGNGHVIPGGPLRAPLIDQLRYANGIVTMGDGQAAMDVVRRAARAGRSVFSAHLKPKGTRALKGARVLAFAGIGNPDKFYDTLRMIGAEVVATRSFPDHYPYSEDDVAELSAQAEAERLQLVTTEKDLVRLHHGHGPVRDFAATVRLLPVEAVFESSGMPERIVAETVTAWRERSL
ncbi:tetraacyldisaccharide 4'-kinase [Chelativorans sp. YIM 93263]|uniref:tetraacyldisaccharide 4'-kinase n=1 Tax=Chelativorans sp. YIM 93263 TaxID=2906648 RepID=UPI0023785995|nr:tetraacyldisaccharide 4'-kinase [Chelativorans sp. YIM 93263]